jgi:hypothetical protein
VIAAILPALRSGGVVCAYKVQLNLRPQLALIIIPTFPNQQRLL